MCSSDLGTNKTKIEVSNLAISINALPVNFWSDLSWIGYIYIERETHTQTFQAKNCR